MTSWKRLRHRSRYYEWVTPQSARSESELRSSVPAAITRSWPSGWKPSAAPLPTTRTSYQRCWIVRVRIARSTRSGMCSRKFMGAIASRSSSDTGTGATFEDRASLTGVIEHLTRARPGKHQVVTCYLKLEPRDRARGKYLIKLKNRVKTAVQGLDRLGLERGVAEEVLRDLDRLQQFLRSPGNLPPTQGVALFACEGIELFETVPLPAVYRSRLAVDVSPLVRELASIEDEFGRLLTVVLDRTSARFFEVTAYDTRELPGLRADSTRGKRFHAYQNGSGGWGEHTYNNRIREEKQRHYEA